jgi:hypothetical protein
LRLFCDIDHQRVLVQLTDGAVLDVTDVKSVSASPLFQLPSVCQWVECTKLAMQPCVIGLTNFSKLFVNTTPVSNECNSFVVTPRYLVFTTLQNKLRFIPLYKPLDSKNKRKRKRKRKR